MQPTTYHERTLVDHATAELRAKLAASEYDCEQVRDELTAAGVREAVLIAKVAALEVDNDKAHELADYYRNRLLKLKPPQLVKK